MYTIQAEYFPDFTSYRSRLEFLGRSAFISSHSRTVKSKVLYCSGKKCVTVVRLLILPLRKGNWSTFVLQLCSNLTLTVQMPQIFYNLLQGSALSSQDFSFGEKAEFFSRAKKTFSFFQQQVFFSGHLTMLVHVNLWWRRLTLITINITNK